MKHNNNMLRIIIIKSFWDL